jgi:hypothetical protein
MSRETVEMLRYELERKRDPARNPARSNTITIALRDAEELLAALDERDAFADALEHERSLNESVVAPMREALKEIAAEDPDRPGVSNLYAHQMREVALRVLLHLPGQAKCSSAALDERDALREALRLKMIEAGRRTTEARDTFEDGYFNGLASAIDEMDRTASEPQGSRPKLRSPMRPFPGDSE